MLKTEAIMPMMIILTEAIMPTTMGGQEYAKFVSSTLGAGGWGPSDIRLVLGAYAEQRNVSTELAYQMFIVSVPYLWPATPVFQVVHTVQCVCIGFTLIG